MSGVHVGKRGQYIWIKDKDSRGEYYWIVSPVGDKLAYVDTLEQAIKLCEHLNGGKK